MLLKVKTAVGVCCREVKMRERDGRDEWQWEENERMQRMQDRR